MKNLEQFGLVALDTAELQQVQGGNIIDDIGDAISAGIDWIKGIIQGAVDTISAAWGDFFSEC